MSIEEGAFEGAVEARMALRPFRKQPMRYSFSGLFFNPENQLSTKNESLKDYDYDDNNIIITSF